MPSDDVPPRSPSTPEEFRDWLRVLRERAGYSQEAAASAIQSSRRNMNRWERLGHDPGGLTLLRLLRLYGVMIEPPPPTGVVPPTLAEQLEDLHEMVSRLLRGERVDAPEAAEQGAAIAGLKRQLDELAREVRQLRPEVVALLEARRGADAPQPAPRRAQG